MFHFLKWSCNFKSLLSILFNLFSFHFFIVSIAFVYSDTEEFCWLADILFLRLGIWILLILKLCHNWSWDKMRQFWWRTWFVIYDGILYRWSITSFFWGYFRLFINFITVIIWSRVFFDLHSSSCSPCMDCFFYWIQTLLRNGCIDHLFLARNLIWN